MGYREKDVIGKLPEVEREGRTGRENGKEDAQREFGAGGTLDADKVTKALLQYRNTPLAGLGVSPSELMFGRKLKDALPRHPKDMGYQASFSKKYGLDVSNHWAEFKKAREVGAMRKMARNMERYDEHTRPMARLSVGDSVAFQNREGPKPLRWDRT